MDDRSAWERTEARLKRAIRELADALDPQHQGGQWPDPVKWDGRPLAVQAGALLAIVPRYESETPRGCDWARIQAAAQALREEV